MTPDTKTTEQALVAGRQKVADLEGAAVSPPGRAPALLYGAALIVGGPAASFFRVG